MSQRTRIGIDMDQYLRLQLNPAAHRWFTRLSAALQHTFLLVALDESLGRWEAHHYARPYRWPTGNLETYTTVLYTPPAHPEWLVPIASQETAA